MIVCLEEDAKMVSYGPSDATAGPSSLASLKLRMVNYPLHAVADAWNTMISSICDSVCACVRVHALKGKQLELSTSNLVPYTHTLGMHCIDLKVMDQGVKVTRL